MDEISKLETDYLVVGAGALGMSFVDSVIEHSDADVVIVERRHRPGGHWLDSYPFVQLHQPSMNYGVNSTPLGRDRVEPDGPDMGFYERASGTEICGYFDEVMRHRLLASGRVRFFPMCDYLGDHRFRSTVTDQETEVAVRRRVVDATYMASRVPATEAPPFDVAEGVQCVPVGGLVNVTRPPAGYVIVGGGKTALDAGCWLLDRGTSPDDITWIRPRDSWLLNRKYFQPGDGVIGTFEGVVFELEAIAECDSIDEIFARLEDREMMLRTDRNVRPTMMKGGTLSLGELEQLRRIDDVVRLGHVERIELDEIVLEHGSIPTSPDHLHIHCASAGLSDNPPKSIFTDDTVTLQVVTRVSLPLSAGLIGFLETTDRSTAEKNRLCPPNPWPQTPFDWVRTLLGGMKTELAWQQAPDIQAWVDSSRLNLMGGLDRVDGDDAVSELQVRFLTALFPALEKLEQLATDATPAERARMT
jgi:hypothetical protein